MRWPSSETIFRPAWLIRPVVSSASGKKRWVWTTSVYLLTAHCSSRCTSQRCGKTSNVWIYILNEGVDKTDCVESLNDSRKSLAEEGCFTWILSDKRDYNPARRLNPGQPDCMIGFKISRTSRKKRWVWTMSMCPLLHLVSKPQNSCLWLTRIIWGNIVSNARSVRQIAKHFGSPGRLRKALKSVELNKLRRILWQFQWSRTTWYSETA